MLRRRSPIDTLVLGSMFYSGHQLTDQRLTRAFARMDERRVAYVDPGVKLRRPRKHNSQGSSGRFGTSDVDGVEVLAPVMLPYATRAVGSAVNAVARVLQLTVLLRRRLHADTHIVVFSAHPAVMRWARRHRHVFVVKDDYVAGATLTGSRARTVAARRRRTLTLAAKVVAVSAELQASLLREGVAADVIGPGVDMPPALGTTAPPTTDPRPCAVFIGMLSARIDLDLVSAVLDAGWRILFVGGRAPTLADSAQLARIEAHPGTTLLGWQAPDDVAKLASSCQVGLLPYTHTAFNRASSPLKLLEYLAAGVPVVSTTLPSVTDLDPPGVFTADSPDAVPAALSHALAWSHDESRRTELTDFARRHSWDARARQYLEVVNV